MKSRDLLKHKGSKVWSVRDNERVYQVLEILVAQKIGSVVVLDKKGRIAGIISERDIMRVCFYNRDDFDQLPVKKVMTKVVVIAKPDDTLEHLMDLMTQNRVRHLPVMAEGKLEGLISIGDVVRASYQESVENNKQLMEYMHGVV